MPSTNDMKKEQVTDLRRAIVESIQESAKSLNKTKPAENENDTLAELNADVIRLGELANGRVSVDTLNLYGLTIEY